MSARSARTPGLSEKDCFPGKGTGGGPVDDDNVDRYWSKNVSGGQGHNSKMSSWRGRVLAARCSYYYKKKKKRRKRRRRRED